jgi:uncharacterized iron-regulated membrane protein
VGFLDKPQRLWWRKALFQIHLWVGVAVCLYIAVIGITGSLLVFRDEIERASFRSALLRQDPGKPETVPLAQMADTVQSRFPERVLTVAYRPRKPDENAIIMTSNKAGKEDRYVFVSPSTGHIAGEVDPDRFWMYYVGQIHYFLLLSEPGLIVNGVGAAFLLLLTLSGLVIWWPGIKSWKRGFGVKLKANWRRINFDFHNAMGFWTFPILLVWSISSIYFAWPEQVEHLLNHVSSTSSLTPPRVMVTPPKNGKPLGLDLLLAQGSIASPQAQLFGAFLPRAPRMPITVLMSRGEQGDFFDMDYVYVDPYTGKRLGSWYRGMGSTWGSKLITLLSLLHFGTSWGLTVKVIWFLLGMSLPLLSITGLLMYWNRKLRHKWKALKQRPAMIAMPRGIADAKKY